MYEWKPPASSTDTPTGGPAVRPPGAEPEATSGRVAGEAATVADVTEEFLAAAEAGKARNRNGRRYRPSALRDVAGCLRNYVVPELGDLRLRDVQPHDLQRLVDELAAGDLSLSRIRSVVSAIRALYAYAIERGIVDVSAAEGIEIARVEEPLWEDGAYDADEADSPPHRTGGWAPAHTRSQRYIPRDPGERTVPELVLSFLLRLVVTVFVIMALIALAQALLLPA